MPLGEKKKKKTKGQIQRSFQINETAMEYKGDSDTSCYLCKRKKRRKIVELRKNRDHPDYRTVKIT